MVKNTSRYSLLAITLVLISSLALSPIPALESSNITVASSGTIARARDPGTSWYGVDFYRLVPDQPPYNQSPLFYYGLLNFIGNLSGVNCIRIHTYANVTWGYFDPNYPYTKTWLQEACREAKAKGIKVILSCFANDFGENDWAGKAEIILNESGEGTKWITNFAQIIKECQPAGVEVMNEPPDASLSGNPNLTFQAYRTFVVKCCTAFRQVDPNVGLFVMSCPFWDLSGWASDPLTEFSNVIYTAHIYYDSAASTSYNWGEDYYAGNLANAKTELYSAILGEMNIQSMINERLPICWTEAGAETGANLPNWSSFLTDLYAFVKQYDQSFIQFALANYPPEDWGILNSTWTGLNPVGLVWEQNFLS